MRLLLDEHYPVGIAAELRGRGHDVVEVAERSDLAGLDDRSLIAAAARERRAIVTENVRDFAVLFREILRAGEEHHGIVVVFSRAFPRAGQGVGAIIRALDSLLASRPAADALVNQVRWLEPAGSERPG